MAEIFHKINWIDILIVIVLARSSYVGFTKGFGWEFFRFIGYIVSVLATIYYYEYVSQLIGNYVSGLYPIANLVSFTGLYVGILTAFKFLYILLEKIIKIETFSTFEKVGGLLFGLMRGCVLLSFILVTFILTPVPYFEKSVKERSYMGPAVSRIAPFIYEKAAGFFPALKLGQRNEALLNLTTVIK